MAANPELTVAVTALKNGDKNAFEKIYNLTAQQVYFTALKIVKNETDAEDIVQEAYISMLNGIDNLEKPESFMSWLNMITANKARDMLKKENPLLFDDAEEGQLILESVENEYEEFKPGADIEQEELRSDVMKLIEGLSDEKRTAVMLFYYDDLSLKQIAESLGVNENTVNSRLVQAKKDLAKGVKELEKKNGKLLGVAPIPLVIWALRASSQTAYAAFISEGAAAGVLAAITSAVGGTGVAAGAAASAGILTKIATLSVAKKVIFGVTAVVIVAGSALGVKTVVQKNKEPVTENSVEDSTEFSDETEKFAIITTETEQIDGAEFTEEKSSVTEDTDFVSTVSEKEKNSSSSVMSETKSNSSAEKDTDKTTSAATETEKSTTVKGTTEKSTTAKKTTTTKRTTTKKETTTKHTTTKKVTTTKRAETEKEATTASTTKATTKKETTTKQTTTENTTKKSVETTKAMATVNIAITQFGTPVGSTTIKLEDGSQLTINDAYDAAKEKGYEPMEYSGLNLPLTVSGGKTYNITVDCE